MHLRRFIIKSYYKSPTFFLLSLTSIISFFFFLWGVNSWRFSYAGDEWPFYIAALKLLTLPYIPNPFSFDGVYFTHSLLVTMYQSLFLRILGPSNFAWRLSNIILIFPISFFFYRFVRDSFNKEIAIFSTIILQSSFFLANFFKIGYDNPQGFTFFIICLYLSNHLVSHPTRKKAALLGLTFGISAYIYMGLAFPLFLWPYLLQLVRQLSNKKDRTTLFALVGMYLLVLSPLLIHSDSLVLLYSALEGSGVFPFWTIVNDFTLFYRNNDYLFNHFVVGPYLDGISQIFCLIGTIVVFSRIRKKPYILFLLAYVTTTIFIGATSSDWFSPTTRGMFLLPFGFVFAGIGLTFVINKIKNKTVSFIFCWYIIFAIFLLNVYQSQVGVFSHQIVNRSGYTSMSLLLKSMMEAKASHADVLIVISQGQTIAQYINMFPYMVKAYNLESVPYTIISPKDFICTQSNTEVLFFRTDTTAKRAIVKMNCQKDPSIHYIMLSPSITFY